MLKGLWKILNNSFFGLVVGVIITIVVYNIEKKEIKIGYTILNESRIATGDVDTSITIMFKKDTVPNINIVEIAFWNDGTEFIDNNLFSQSDLFRLTSDSSLRILGYRVIRKSRADLNCNINYSKEIKKPNIFFQFVGDDGLERYDGIDIQIVYSGSDLANWYLRGRVKGYPNSYKFYSNDEILYFNEGRSILRIFFLVGFLISLSLFILLLYSVLKRKLIIDDLGSGIVLFGIISFFLYLTSLKVYYLFFYSDLLSWVLKR
jgi:hypothetical protein